MAISERKKKILAAVVDEYVRTAEPVGSKAIAQSAGLGCSSATIRNELAELVARGYLEQPHTSAGRVPTPLGYRMYVNELMVEQNLSDEERAQIAERLSGSVSPDQLMNDAGRIASQLTSYPALALTARPAATIRRFDLIYIDANTFIIVLLLSTDAVKNKLVHLPVSVDQNMIQKLSTLFNAHFTGVREAGITPAMIHAAERAAEDNLGITAVIAAFAIETL
ncbi:MAG: heat-inducible transcription repressor HrcA, partial [Oscillospiraceae bacterium]|nr:heat-inducible transcription repressor HrcA [Oscillospiraceae bacterium]